MKIYKDENGKLVIDGEGNTVVFANGSDTAAASNQPACLSVNGFADEEILVTGFSILPNEPVPDAFSIVQFE